MTAALLIAAKVAAIWCVAGLSFCALWTAAHGGWRADR